MKSISVYLIIFTVAIFTLTNCKKIDNSSYIKSDIVLNLTSWSLPDTSRLSVPFNITLYSKIDNTCTSNLKFCVVKYDSITYHVFADATFENHGEICDALLVNKDTTMSITIDKKGKNYFYFAKDDVFNKDSIFIIP
jgi:hypothetical protein